MEFNKNLVYLKKKKYLNFLLRSVCIITRMPCKYIYLFNMRIGFYLPLNLQLLYILSLIINTLLFIIIYNQWYYVETFKTLKSKTVFIHVNINQCTNGTNFFCFKRTRHPHRSFQTSILCCWNGRIQQRSTVFRVSFFMTWFTSKAHWSRSWITSLWTALTTCWSRRCLSVSLRWIPCLPAEHTRTEKSTFNFGENIRCLNTQIINPHDRT